MTRRARTQRQLFVRVLFADTGEVKAEFLSPFQSPRFRRIALALLDTDGDGVTDAVLLSAKRGRKSVQRQFAV